MSELNPNYKDSINLFTKNINKGYVFKLKANIKNDEIFNLQKHLVEQLKSGILIYPGEILELIDIYKIDLKKLQ